MKYHGICNRVFQKNTLNTIADDTNSAGDKIHPNNYYISGYPKIEYMNKASLCNDHNIQIWQA